MSSTSPRPSRLRLGPVAYENLRQQVLRRDGWRCQPCGTWMSNINAIFRTEAASVFRLPQKVIMH